MNSEFGKIGKLIKRQTNRGHFSMMPVGELFMILNSLDLPAYDALAIFPNFKPHEIAAQTNGEVSYTGYLERGSYEIIGDIFTDASLIQPDHHLYIKEVNNYIKQ